jgi:hypothetical protein
MIPFPSQATRKSMYVRTLEVVVVIVVVVLNNYEFTLQDVLAQPNKTVCRVAER